MGQCKYEYDCGCTYEFIISPNENIIINISVLINLNESLINTRITF